MVTGARRNVQRAAWLFGTDIGLRPASCLTRHHQPCYGTEDVSQEVLNTEAVPKKKPAEQSAPELIQGRCLDQLTTFDQAIEYEYEKRDLPWPEAGKHKEDDENLKGLI